LKLENGTLTIDVKHKEYMITAEKKTVVVYYKFQRDGKGDL